MKKIFIALALAVPPWPLFAQGAPPQAALDQPYTMEYYYKVQWGHQQEFLQLFLKNHYPLLKKNVESGRMVFVKIETPRPPHAGGRALGLSRDHSIQEFHSGNNRES